MEAERVSGSLTIKIVLLVCFAMVATAIIQRSRQTSQIRQFYQPTGAYLIQKATRVSILFPNQDPQSPWKDASEARGLIHFRATLVDDRYFNWSKLSPADPQELAAKAPYRFRFEEKGQSIEIAFDSDCGFVYALPTKQKAPLIDSSTQAFRQYLVEIEHQLTGR